MSIKSVEMSSVRVLNEQTNRATCLVSHRKYEDRMIFFSLRGFAWINFFMEILFVYLCVFGVATAESLF